MTGTAGKEHYDETRYITISNFRNLGPLIEGRQHRVRLVINRGLDRGCIGGVVTLVGANNCGKSNVLAALDAWYRGQVSQEDYTDFVSDKRDPQLEMTVAGNRYACEAPLLSLQDLKAALMTSTSYGLFMDYYRALETADPNDHARVYVSSVVVADRGQDGEDIPISSSTLTLEQYCQYIEAGFEFLEIFDVNMLDAVRDTGVRSDQMFFAEVCYRILSQQPSLSLRYGRSWSALLVFLENFPNGSISGVFGNPSTTLTRGFEMEYGYAISQRVFVHTPHRFRTKDLTCDPYALTPAVIDILRSAGCSAEMLIDAYKGGRRSRRELQRNINVMLSDISSNFSDLMGIENGAYVFSLVLDSNEIRTEMHHGNRRLDIDHQSEGFRWLFDFFISIFGKRKFYPGDIILIDEFGNMLNYSTVGELMGIIRNYARASGITFVLATQNPMAVDIRHLDEVRVVTPLFNGGAIINNRFDRSRIEDHDILRPILEGLTVSRNYLRSSDRKTVFVAGFTEYFVLNALSGELNDRGFATDVDFLPINGLGATNVEMSEILVTLRRLEHKALVLVDDDEQGDRFVVYSKGVGGITVVTFAEVTEDPVLKDISSFFTPEERDRFGIDSGNFDRLACFSQDITSKYEEIGGMTRIRFSKLMKALSKMLQ